MGYLDILEKDERYNKIKEQEDKIAGIEAQFNQSKPEKIE